jgi:hypothetical protein
MTHLKRLGLNVSPALHKKTHTVMMTSYSGFTKRSVSLLN